LLHQAEIKEVNDSATRTADTSQLLERVASVPNLAQALLNVARNKGAPGIDGQSVKEVLDSAPQLLPTLSHALRSGSYQPGDIRRVWIPKPGGGTRGLGIPNVIDRWVQQAVLQVLEPIFEPTFHDSSHGFRRHRGAQTAIAEATTHLAEGYGITVDIDLSKFFDRVHHQRLLSRLAQQVQDGRILKLVHRMLKAKVVMPEGTRIATHEGAPQGGPLSPLLSNVVLDELDWELERRGLRFVRYADDFSVFVRSERAGRRVMGTVRKFIEKRLRLVVNEQKSSVSRPFDLSFLGFRLGRSPEGQITIDISVRTKQRMDVRIRELTPRNWGQSLAACLANVNRYLRGWFGYFQLCTDKVLYHFQKFDAHIRRRLRAMILRQKKRPPTVFRHLRSRGVPHRMSRRFANSRRGLWYRSNQPALQRAYPNKWFASRLVSLHTQWHALHRPHERVLKQRVLFT
jgi:group II intron reverse transcriptase/maturase